MTDMIETVARAKWEARREFARKAGVELEPWGDGSFPLANGILEETRAAIEAMSSGWVELKDAPLDEVGFVWCADPAWGDDTTQRGRVVEWGNQRIAVGSFRGFDITHWRPAPISPAALQTKGGGE